MEQEATINSSGAAIILETERLRLRRVTEEDAGFILSLLNEPSFIQNIGDKGVRTLDDARGWVRTGPNASHEQHGFGLDLVELRDSGTPIGFCGLLKRDHLEHPDVGYAFVPEFWSLGYAVESAAAVVKHAREVLGLGRLLAVTSPDNVASGRVLERIGFQYQGMTDWTNDEQVRLYASEPPAAEAISTS
jgi:[ribosomal protein S5]-alanine N-acetyltransferase